jgi:hypothetical protein
MALDGNYAKLNREAWRMVKPAHELPFKEDEA